MKAKKKPKEQASMFTLAETYDIPEDTMPEQKEVKSEPVKDSPETKPLLEFRLRVAPDTKACPNCGEIIKLAPDGTRRCSKCTWWQGNKW